MLKPRSVARTMAIADVHARRGQQESEESWRKRKAADAFKDLGSVVYFIRSEPYIKIGTTTNLRNRFRRIGEAGSRAQRTDILAVLPGGYELKQEVHQRFAASLAKGKEWFHPTDDLIDYINEIRSRCNVPLISGTRRW